MLRRLALSLCISFFTMASMAASEDDAAAQTAFELERSIAILQLSKANLEDYKVMNEKVTSLENRVDFFAVLTLLLCVAFAVMFMQNRHQQKQLLAFEQNQKASLSTEE